MSEIAKRKMMVHINPKISSSLPSTISSAPILSSLIYTKKIFDNVQYIGLTLLKTKFSFLTARLGNNNVYPSTTFIKYFFVQKNWINTWLQQKQPSRGVLRIRCSKKYAAKSIPKCDFNKGAFATLLKSHFGMGVLL